MNLVISAVLLGAVTIPAGVGLIILGQDELKNKETVTSGDGMIVIAGLFLILVIGPIWAFLAS